MQPSAISSIYNTTVISTLENAGYKRHHYYWAGLHARYRQKAGANKSPKNASAARFLGLCCYRRRSRKRWLSRGGQRRRNRLRAGAGKPRKLALSPSGPHLSRSRVGRGGVHVRTAPFTPANGNESLFSRPAPSPPASQTQPRPDAFSLLF